VAVFGKIAKMFFHKLPSFEKMNFFSSLYDHALDPKFLPCLPLFALMKKLVLVTGILETRSINCSMAAIGFTRYCVVSELRLLVNRECFSGFL